MIFGVRDLYFSTLELKNNPRKIEFQNSIKYSIKILWPYTGLIKNALKISLQQAFTCSKSTIERPK